MKTDFPHEFFKHQEMCEDASRYLWTILEKYGWEHTSDNLIHYWMYEKKIDGKTYVVSGETALKIEEALHANDETWKEYSE